MSYRDGAGYGHGGYHTEIPPAQLGDIPIDPDEFPNVAHHLQSLHLTHPSSSAGSASGYPEDGARHLFVDQSGAHYYTADIPPSTATYTGYNYIQAPESGNAPHAFAGATIRSPIAPNSYGMGYFDTSWPPPPPPNILPFQLGSPFTPAPPQPAQNKRYSYAAQGTPTTTYQQRSYPQLGNGTATPQSATSAFPPATPLSLPPPSPAVSSSSSAKTGVFPGPTRRFSYDDGGSQFSANFAKKYQEYMQNYQPGNEARDRYDPSQDGYDEGPRGRRPASGYYRPSGEGYIPGATVPRTATKTPSHGGEVGVRRPTVHQPRPPNSRHSSSESGDAEPTYRPSGRYEPDYNGNGARPKATKSRPNSFSFPRPGESDPSFGRYGSISQDAPFDPRSSTGSLGNARYGPTDRYYPNYGDAAPGSIIVHSTPGSRGGRTYNYAPMRSQPIGTTTRTTYPVPDEGDFEQRRRVHRSKSRFRARTPGPEERASASEDDRYRMAAAKSRPSSPSSQQQRAKSRRRHESPEPNAYRAKSRMRSKSRPRPEIIQATRPMPGESPNGPTTPGVSRPKTPMPPASSASDTEALLKKELEMKMEAERIEREKAREAMEQKTIQEIYDMQRSTSEQESRHSYEPTDKENQAYYEQHRPHRTKSRHRSRHRHRSRSASNDRSEESQKEERRREREARQEREREWERERAKDSDQERERQRERERRRGERERERERDRIRDNIREETSQKSSKMEPSSSTITDPALANPMIENLNPPGRNTRERAGVQPGQSFIRPDLLCAMRALKLCVVEEDPTDDHAHNRLLRLDCGHGFHEDCLRSAVSSRERIPMNQVDLEAEKLWCERCRAAFGKKAGM